MGWSRASAYEQSQLVTEYGIVRTFGQADFNYTNFGTTNASVSPFVINGPPSGLSGSSLMGVGGGYVSLGYVFVQFAGFTFGKSSSAYGPSVTLFALSNQIEVT